MVIRRLPQNPDRYTCGNSVTVALHPPIAGPKSAGLPVSDAHALAVLWPGRHSHLDRTVNPTAIV